MFRSAVLLIVGICLGWVLRPYAMPVGEVDSGRANSHEALTVESELGGQPQLKEESKALLERDGVLALIEQQEVEQVLANLQHIDLDKQRNRSVYVALHNNLYRLLEQQNWRQLQAWTTAMLAEGYNFSVLYLMDAKIALHQGELLMALDGLFAAQHYAEGNEEVANIQTEIENVVVDLMNRYREGNTRVSRQSALDVLQYVMEKQPENPLFGLEISILYADGGDYPSAIDTINIIPYSEKYQDTIVALKTRYLSAMSSLQQATVAIPLEKVGQHFYVTAFVDQRSLNLLIDTGATTTALGREVISSLYSGGFLGGDVGAVSIGTANGIAEVNSYQANVFSIGSFAVEDFQLLEVELGDSGEFDGLLGMNFLSLFEFELDQSNRQLFLTPK
ncbi:hypothetical protein A9Q99_23470 [Gammaproteobacteria bacterium 45_16_T64]|nr:hypothetical protein A9Q99_23470 [Gammaproteobacteria bacterium 45_16_T64]